MHLPGMNGQRQELLMFEESFFQTEAVADDDILWAEDGPGKVAAIRTAENFDQVFGTFKSADKLMNQMDIQHKPKPSTADLPIQQCLRAKFAPN